MCDGLYRYLLDAKNDVDRTKTISNAVIIVLRNLIIANAVYLVISFIIDLKYKYWILIQFDISLVSSVWMQIVRGLKDNRRYAVSGVIMTFVTLISNIIMVAVCKLRVDGLIVSSILAAITVVVYLEKSLKIYKYIKIKESNQRILAELTFYSLPLIPTALSWWFMNVSDRYILNYFKGTEANGIYAIANKFPAIIVMINSVFYSAWQESAISEYDSNDRDQFYTKMFNRLMTLEFSTIIVLLAFTKYFMSFMVNVKFINAWEYVPFLYFGAVFASFSAFYGTGYLSSKETKGAFYTTVYGAVINIVLNILMVPYIGIQGASLSTMIAFLIVWLIRMKQTQKYFIIRINRFNLITLSIISIIFLWLYFNNYHYWQTPLLMAASIFLLLFFNRQIWGSILLARLKLWPKRKCRV